MKRSFLFLFFAAALGISACQKNDNLVEEIKTIELDAKSARLLEADNAFGIELFKTIREGSSDDNLMISPLSVSVAMAMAYNGAAAETKTEMEKVLHLYGLSVEEINQSYKTLIHALQSLDDNVVFELANSIFYQEGFPVKQDFFVANRTYYNAEVRSLDFSSPASVDIINAWVADKTNHKIMKIIESLSADSRMILLNAVYFNGIWTSEFNEKSTRMRDFHFSATKTGQVAMMSKEEQLQYLVNKLFEAVRVPYGNGQYNMLVMLPVEGKTTQDIIDQLSKENWQQWNESMKTKEQVVITLPRFKFHFEAELNQALINMGMKKAFNRNEANFSKISDLSLYISKVKHKSFIDVNEVGTEASAVTSVEFEITSAGPGQSPQKIYFTADRPFLFAITEKDTGAILFIGEVQNPEYQSQN